MFIQMISVGGTIDKVYFDKLSTYQIGGPCIRDILEHLVLNFDYDIISLVRKDSLDMTDEDRELIHHLVRQESSERILITHGTDTIIDTAKRLSDIEGKVVVLTGAMEPAVFRSSDATFNVGCAIAAVQIMPPGVYIAINGRIYHPEQIRKNRAEGRFVEVEA
jgi:L-asparaginase